MKAGPRLILSLFYSAIIVAFAITAVDARDRGGQAGDRKSSSASADTDAAKKSTGAVQTGPVVRDHSGSGNTPAPPGFTAQPPKNTGTGTVRDHRTPWTPSGHPCGDHRGCK